MAHKAGLNEWAKVAAIVGVALALLGAIAGSIAFLIGSGPAASRFVRREAAEVVHDSLDARFAGQCRRNAP